MSIPKEPRQLMINIMYLVLTALLALNVSAEVFNAFKLVDKGLVKSNKALDDSMAGLPDIIKDGAKTRPSLAKYAERIEPIKEKSDELSSYLKDIVETMIYDKDENGEARGGYRVDSETGEVTDDLILAKDYGVTTRTLIDPENPEGGLGNEVKQRLEEFKADIMSFIDEEDKAAFQKEVSVQIDEETWQKKDKASWAHMNFDHMPLQAVIPLFSKYINDVKSTEAAALNYLKTKVGAGGTTVVLDKYEVVSAPEKSYIIKGEKYKTDIFLSAAAGADSNTGISYSVNGRRLNAKDGVASFEETANSLGKKKYTASASLTDPVTGETKTFKKEFEYEVGQRSVAVSATKMNVFYIGVDNPVSVTAAGVPSNQIKVSMGGSGGGSINKSGDGNYVVKVTSPTPKGQFAKVNVSAPGLNESRDFRVKRIPSPVPMLGKKRGGTMGSGEFKLYQSIRGELENFDFDAKCQIKGFRFVYAAKRQDAIIEVNPGGKFNGKVKSLVAKAKPGDRYYFENIKCTCPGDKAPRAIGDLGVKIN